MTLKIKRSAHQMRKTEHKMSDLSVTGSNVSSGYKTRSQMARSATQPAQQRPQRRYNSALHKVRLISSLFLIISFFLERILMEHIETIFSLDSKLVFISICSVRIRSRK